MPSKLPEWLKLISGNVETEDDEPVDMLLSEPVGFNRDTYEGISARVFGYTLNGIPKKKPVNLLINCLGGSYSEGIAMHNMILARGNVNTVVVGMAASMAAVIAQGGATRRMMPGTMLMIHNPSCELDGDHRDATKGAALLKQVKDNLVDVLQSRTKLGKKKISDLMDDETYMTPDEAKALGFCDEVMDGKGVYNIIALKETHKNNFRQVYGHSTVPAGGRETEKEKQDKPMKLITATLIQLGLLSSAAITEEAEICKAVENAHKVLKADEQKLKDKVQGFETANKTRVTNKVEALITGKIAKAERKDTLIAMGMRDEAELDNYIADMSEGRQTPAPGTRRGAPPVPKNESTDEPTNDDKAKELREKMKTASPSEQAVMARELRKLRGHETLFAAVK